MAVKDEERCIEQCIAQLKWADEIVIVDNGSSDQTVKICKKYTDKILFSNSPFTGMRVNCGITHATYEWILNIDADEIVTTNLRNEIFQKINDDKSDCMGYAVPIRHHFMGRALVHGGWYPCYTLRFYRNGKARYLVADHHVQPVVEGKTGYLFHPILHRGPNDVATFLQKMNLYTSNSAREHGKERRISQLDLLLRPPLIFIKRFICLRGFLDGFPGFVIAVLSALYVFIDKVKLKEVQNN